MGSTTHIFIHKLFTSVKSSEREEEFCSRGVTTFGPDCSAVSLNDGASDSQSSADSRKLSVRMEALEYFKKSRLTGGIEAGAVIPNHERPIVFGAGAEGDPRSFCFAREFPRVIEEALQQNGDQSFVALSLQSGGNGDLSFSIRFG